VRTPRPDLAEVIGAAKESYRQRYGLTGEQGRVLRDLTRCRTAVLGGHRYRCDRCGHEKIAYNSCRNRHCPTCQAQARAKWLEDRAAELLPVPYFHVVFTIPDLIGPLALFNRRRLYGILLKAAAQSLQALGRDPKHLGAEIGFLAILHTWGQQLQHHPHVHCVVPGGGLSPDRTRWIRCRSPRFFLPVRPLSRLFRGKFLALLGRDYTHGKLKLPGKLASLQNAECWSRWMDELREHEWVVYAKPPFGGPEQVLKYLARYTHRVAISNRRIVSVEAGQVTFRYKDYARGQSQRTLRLEAVEFLRRFLLHLLPSGFMRIRYYGFLANRARAEKLALLRRLLGAAGKAKEVRGEQADRDGPPADPWLCPHCRKGRLVQVGTVPASSSLERSPPALAA